MKMMMKKINKMIKNILILLIKFIERLQKLE